MRQILSFFATMLLFLCSADNKVMADVPPNVGKTLIVYYSYTGNCREIVTTLTSQIEADVLEIQPAEKGLRYEANGYALGTELLNAINANPDDINSYPAIDPVSHYRYATLVESNGCHHADIPVPKRFANGWEACRTDCIEPLQQHRRSS